MEWINPGMSKLNKVCNPDLFIPGTSRMFSHLSPQWLAVRGILCCGLIWKSDLSAAQSQLSLRVISWRSFLVDERGAQPIKCPLLHHAASHQSAKRTVVDSSIHHIITTPPPPPPHHLISTFPSPCSNEGYFVLVNYVFSNTLSPVNWM